MTTLPVRVARVVLYQWHDAHDLRVLVGVTKEHDHQFPGGKLDEGESPEEAAVRETWEECGIALSPDQLVFVRSMEDPNFPGTFINYYMTEVGMSVAPLDSKELFHLKFARVEDVVHLFPRLTTTSQNFWLEEAGLATLRSLYAKD